MASLYLAHRTGPQGFARPVALKVIHPHLSQDAQFVRMFVDEALLCARIRHPNVVHVEELGQHAGAYYLAMEYVDGCSLADVLERLSRDGELMDPRVAVTIACAVLEGLHATHTVKGDAGEELEVVHRDVSPSNILIDRTGHVKLIDFGIAKARGRAVETSAGTLKGKYGYMSPEQAWGRDIDLRTDLYAAAVVLWEMLATRPLFSSDSDLGLLELARASNIPRLTPFLPSIPEALDGVLAWGLAANREDRPPSARALRKALLEAFPEARETDDSEIAQLVARTSIVPSRPPGFVQPTGILGPTLASTPTGQAQLGSDASVPDGPLSQVALTNLGRLGRPGRAQKALALGLLALCLAAIAAFAFQRLTAEPSRAAKPVAAPNLPADPRAAAAPLAEPPHQEPAASPILVAPQTPEPAAPGSTAPARARARRDRKRAPNARNGNPSSFDGVPIVDKPGF